jgi:hypothetical protein
MSNVQVDFFSKIKDHIPEFENLAQCVADALQISQNEAYKAVIIPFHLPILKLLI